jgi:hypothetical protein
LFSSYHNCYDLSCSLFRIVGQYLDLSLNPAFLNLQKYLTSAPTFPPYTANPTALPTTAAPLTVSPTVTPTTQPTTVSPSVSPTSKPVCTPIHLTLSYTTTNSAGGCAYSGSTVAAYNNAGSMTWKSCMRLATQYGAMLFPSAYTVQTGWGAHRLGTVAQYNAGYQSYASQVEMCFFTNLN